MAAQPQQPAPTHAAQLPDTLPAAPQVCFPSSSFFVSFTWCSTIGARQLVCPLDMETQGLVSPG